MSRQTYGTYRPDRSVRPTKPCTLPNVPPPPPPPGPDSHGTEGSYFPHKLRFKPDLTKAYVGGTFDLLHPGHLWLLERARSLVDILIVSLNTDEFSARYKGYQPIYSLEERMRLMSALKFVDGVMINERGEDSKDGILRATNVGPQGKVTHIVHGSDWTGPELLKQLLIDQDWLDQHEIEMLYLDLSPGYSTTSIRKRVIESNKSDQRIEVYDRCDHYNNGHGCNQPTKMRMTRYPGKHIDLCGDHYAQGGWAHWTATPIEEVETKDDN